MDRSRLALPLIVLAQWCGTSLWFSVNGVAASLRDDLGLQEADIGLLTLAVQLGFIVGTLVIAGLRSGGPPPSQPYLSLFEPGRGRHQPGVRPRGPRALPSPSPCALPPDFASPASTRWA